MNSALCVIPLLALGAPAYADPVRAVRGLATTVEVDYAPRLRARADQAPTSPVLVRVLQGRDGKQRVEFIGAVAGSYDLRDHLEREDGRPIEPSLRVPVVVVSNLPADQGPDLYGSAGSWMNWRAHYRELMWTAAGLWFAVPVVVLVVRAVRRPRTAPPPPPAPPPPSVADQLREALEVARLRPLTVDESGRLELLLLRYLGGDDARDGDLVGVLRALREQEGSRPLVLAIERWLHASSGGDAARDEAAAALEELRRTRLEPARTQEAAV